MEEKTAGIDKKLGDLKENLLNMDSVLIAYSGGVDSTFLLKIAHDTLGDKVVAVTAKSLTYPSWEIDQAKTIIKGMGARHIIIETEELDNPKFSSNPLDRCYWCKKELFTRLSAIAKKEGLRYVADGTNFDDTRDFRPGMKAAAELGVRSPLKETKLGKEEIRNLSRKLGLSTWDKPSLACLASRFPYGRKIDRKCLFMVDKAEQFLKELGLTQVRVRYHGQIARIEVLKEEIPELLNEKTRNSIVSKFKKLGYNYVTVDLEGFRSGSMNEALKSR